MSSTSRALPKGPHRLSAAEVRASQRERLVRAMLDLVGERGWANTTVPQVVAQAKVSRNAFYALWEDKTACYLSAVEEEIDELLAAMAPPRPAMGWRELLDHAMDVYIAHWQARPGRARAYLVELPQVGDAAVAQRAGTYERFARDFAALARLMRDERPELPPVPGVAIRAVVVAITEEVAAVVRAGRLAALHGRAGEFKWLVARLLGDDQTAAEFSARAR